VLRDQCSLVHGLSAESLEAPVSEGLRGLAVTTQSSSAAAVTVSCTVAGLCLGEGQLSQSVKESKRQCFCESSP